MNANKRKWCSVVFVSLKKARVKKTLQVLGICCRKSEAVSQCDTLVSHYIVLTTNKKAFAFICVHLRTI
jgi:hypothetical protein